MNIVNKKLLTAASLVAIFSLHLFTATAQVPAGAVKSNSNTSLDQYFTPATAGEMKPDAEGFIRRWLLLEPISNPNRSNTVFTDSYIREAFAKEYFKDQFTVLPKDGDKVTVTVPKAAPAAGRGGMGGFPGGGMPGQTPAAPAAPAAPEMEKVKLTWHALESTRFNVKLFRFATNLTPNKYGVIFWAVTVINAPTEMKNVRMAVGSNSASMWWLNGEEAVILSGDRRMVADDCVSGRLTLKQGKNIVRGAVINGPGMSDFCLRFLDENGQPLKGITVSYK
jgi:hypothetical protein